MTVALQEGDRVFNLIQPQADFIRTEARYPAYVGGWGTGKSTAGIGRAMRFSEMYPGNLGLVGRKEFEDLKDSTIKDFQDYTGLTVNSSREVKLSNGSIIMFRHLEEMNNIQNINLGWYWIEQAEELETEDIFLKLFGRLRRKGFPGSGFITANTNGHNWVYKLWKAGGLLKAVEQMMKERPDLFPEGMNPESFVELYEAKTQDNAHNLEPSFLASLELIRVQKPKLYNRFVMNSWDEGDTVGIMIDPEYVGAAMKRNLTIDPPLRRVVSIDVARFGDDKTVMYAIENNAVIGMKELEKKRTTETTAEAILFAKRAGGDNGPIESFAVDEIGVGAGVADELYELDKDVVFVNSSKSSNLPDKFVNLRAEIYGTGADLFQAGRVQIRPQDTVLAEQLSWAKYKAKGKGLIQVEPKEDIKKRYGGVSPDHADAYLNGLWALPRIHPERVIRKDKYARAQTRRPVESGMSI